MFHLTKFDKEIKTSQNKSVGADLLSKACDLDQKKACYQYGSMCLRGEVIPVSTCILSKVQTIYYLDDTNGN